MRELSKPSTAQCNCNLYTLFLLAEPKYVSCVRVAEVLGEFQHDSVNRFLLRENYTPKDLFEKVKGELVLEGGTASVDRRGRGAGGQRSRGEKVDVSPAIRFQAPEFIYGKGKTWLELQAVSSQNSLFQAPGFIHGVAPLLPCSPAPLLRRDDSVVDKPYRDPSKRALSRDTCEIGHDVKKRKEKLFGGVGDRL